MNQKIIRELNKSNLLKLSAVLLLSAFLVVSLWPKTIEASAPCFNCHPDSPKDWFVGQTRDGAVWGDPVIAEAGDEVFFSVYYHNNVVGTVAKNTKVSLYFPTDYENPIGLTAYLSADNAATIANTLTINLDSAQKLEFSKVALWYPNGTGDVSGAEPQTLAVDIHEEYLEVELGDIQGCFEYRGSVMFQAIITEEEVGVPNLSISKTGKNLTQGQNYFQDVISANPSDRIEFKIEVLSTGTTGANNVTIRDTLPPLIGYEGNLRVNGVYTSGNIFSGLNLGTLAQGQSKNITFETRVASEGNFPYGTTTLVNTAQAWADRVSQRTDTATVNVYRSPPPPSSPGLSIDKLVKNLTDGTSWLNTVSADPSDKLEFRIRITSIGNATAYNVIVEDSLPDRIDYYGDLEIDGVNSSGDIFSGLNLGSLAPDASKTITFEAKVASEDEFSTGTTTLTNSANVRADGVGRIYDTANVKVVKSEVSYVALSVDKEVKNLTKDHTVWYQSWITAKPDDEISFRIKVTSTGTATAEDVIVKDVLPDRLIYKGKLKIDGVSSSKDILDGMNLGDLEPGESKTITFEAKVASKDKFNYGTTGLVNTALAFNEDTATSDAVTVKVYRAGVAGAVTEVPTGVMSTALLSLVITLVIAFLASFALLLRFYIVHGALGKTKENPEEELLRVITEIQKREGNMTS